MFLVSTDGFNVGLPRGFLKSSCAYSEVKADSAHIYEKV